MVALGMVAALAFLSSSQAFMLPANYTDGDVYSFGYDENGAETYHKISHIPAGSDSSGERGPPPAHDLLPSRLAKRYGSSSINADEGVNCNKDHSSSGGDVSLPYDQISRATWTLSDLCKGTAENQEEVDPLVVDGHHGFVVPLGDIQVFMCNMGAADRGCENSDVEGQILKVYNGCGSRPGWYNNGRPSRRSFGYQIKGKAVCTGGKTDADNPTGGS